MKLSDIRSHSQAVEIPLDNAGNKITLQIFTRKGTVSIQREFSAQIEKEMGKLETARKAARVLDRERETLLKPVALLSDEIATLQGALAEATPAERGELRDKLSEAETKRDAMLVELEPALKKLDEKAGKLLEDGQKSLESAVAQKLAFYCKSHDVVDDEEKPLPAIAEFFAENFDFALMEKCSEAIDRALSGPLATAPPTLD